MSLLTDAALVFARVSSLYLTLPVLSTTGVPRAVPVMLALATTALLVPNVPSAGEDIGLVMPLLSEIGFGLMGGFFVRAVFNSLALCGELMGMQMGFAMAQLFDPVQRTSQGPIALLANLLAAMVFLQLDQHASVLVLLADGFDTVPPGSVDLMAFDLTKLSDLGGELFRTGLQLTGPVMLLVLLINVLVGVLGKLAPRMNVFFSVGPLLTTMGGLILLGEALPSVLAAHHHAVSEALKGLRAFWGT